MSGHLRLDELEIGYRDGSGNRSLLRPASAQLRPATVTALLGPNGSGKSTLLLTLCGLHKKLSGTISVNSCDLGRMSARQRARSIAVVLTEAGVPGYLSVRETVALGRHPHTGFLGRLARSDEQAVSHAISGAGIEHLAERSLSRLSDGERRRVMIARAVAQRARILVLDEPLAFLDVSGKTETLHLLRRFAREYAAAVLYSTHDVELALGTADRLWLIDKDRRLHVGSPEDLVLGGQLPRSLGGEGLVFDEDRGGFVSREPCTGSYYVSGPARERRWTAHALRRLGYCVTDSPDGAVHIEASAGPSWRMGGTAYPSISALEEAL